MAYGDTFFPMTLGCRPSMDCIESKIIGGDVFDFHYDSTASTGIASDILVVAGSKDLIFSLLTQSMGGVISAKIYEDAVCSSLGSVVTINARNRATIKTPETAVYSGPGVSTVGTAIVTRLILGASGIANTQIASAIVSGASRVLSAAKNYLIRFVSEADGVRITTDGLFYEVTHGTI